MTDRLRREGGVLWERPTADGGWLRVADNRADAVRALASLSEDDRVAVFSLFCQACGSDNPRCVCQRDE